MLCYLCCRDVSRWIQVVFGGLSHFFLVSHLELYSSYTSLIGMLNVNHSTVMMLVWWMLIVPQSWCWYDECWLFQSHGADIMNADRSTGFHGGGMMNADCSTVMVLVLWMPIVPQSWCWLFRRTSWCWGMMNVNHSTDMVLVWWTLIIPHS